MDPGGYHVHPVARDDAFLVVDKDGRVTKSFNSHHPWYVVVSEDDNLNVAFEVAGYPLVPGDEPLPQRAAEPEIKGLDWKLTRVPGTMDRDEIYKISHKDKPGEYWTMYEGDSSLKIEKLPEQLTNIPPFAFKFDPA